MRADEATPMTTTAAASAAGYSAQQVRDLEARGVIPVAARSPTSGYRWFTAEHVRHLRAYRDLAYAVGPVEARRAMRDIRLQPRDQATALICGFHARLNAEREQALAARHALESINEEATTDAEPVEDDYMTITELSQALGVKASTLASGRRSAWWPPTESQHERGRRGATTSRRSEKHASPQDSGRAATACQMCIRRSQQSATSPTRATRSLLSTRV